MPDNIGVSLSVLRKTAKSKMAAKYLTKIITLSKFIIEKQTVPLFQILLTWIPQFIVILQFIHHLKGKKPTFIQININNSKWPTYKWTKRRKSIYRYFPNQLRHHIDFKFVSVWIFTAFLHFALAWSGNLTQWHGSCNLSTNDWSCTITFENFG